jgi:hypothetical protein
MNYVKLVTICAAIAGAMALSINVQAQVAQVAPIETHPPHSRAVQVPNVASPGFVTRVTGPSGSSAVSFDGYYGGAVRFPIPFQNLKEQGGCMVERIGYAAIKDVNVYCTMFIWNYKAFVGNDPNLRKAADSGAPFAQWAGNPGRNGLFARNQVRLVSGPATLVPMALQSGIVRDAGTPGVDHGKVVVGFTLKPTAANGSVVVSIDGDPRTSNTGSNAGFTRTITW